MGKKIKSREDLKRLRDRVRADLDIRTGPKEMQITVHMGTCGIAAGAREVLSDLAEELSRVSQENVGLRKSGCLGLCDQEPMITVTSPSGDEIRYGRLNKQKVREIVREHILSGRPVKNYLVKRREGRGIEDS